MIRPDLFGRLFLLVGVSILCCPLAVPQDDSALIDKRIFQEIHDHNQVMKNLEYLSDTVGPRLTGSDRLQKAVTWASELSRRYGLENVHVEQWKIAHSWQRGSARARIVEPVLRDLTIAAAGWSPGTAGQLRGKVVYVPATNLEELQTYRRKLEGAIAILQKPADLSWQASPPTVSTPLQFRPRNLHRTSRNLPRKNCLTRLE